MWHTEEMDLGGRTLILNLLLSAVPAGTTDRIFGDELKVRCHIVHFLSLQICNNDINLITSSIVHASQEH